ncbi:keywimysin-related RiPP [Brevibacterium luteolum]|nr:keywimysin-related RiPP [Brevibacterium luteolum]MBU8579695.1 lasso RiPP family leader peptide-containing protein [Brevibacterium luteolum]
MAKSYSAPTITDLGGFEEKTGLGLGGQTELLIPISDYDPDA